MTIDELDKRIEKLEMLIAQLSQCSSFEHQTIGTLLKTQAVLIGAIKDLRDRVEALTQSKINTETPFGMN